MQDGKLLMKEDTDQLRDRTYAITGTREAVEGFIHDKQIISKKRFGWDDDCICIWGP